MTAVASYGALRDRERKSIREFVASAGNLLGRSVLDFGCGKQPYRDLVEAHSGLYVGFDRPEFPASTVSEPVGSLMAGSRWPLIDHHWDAILCTQVIQYHPEPQHLLAQFYDSLRNDGALILTWPTNWPEVEGEDLHRFTRAGMERMLKIAGFVIERCERRAQIVWEGEEFALGYGAIAHAL